MAEPAHAGMCRAGKASSALTLLRHDRRLAPVAQSTSDAGQNWSPKRRRAHTTRAKRTGVLVEIDQSLIIPIIPSGLIGVGLRFMLLELSAMSRAPGA
eukprot:3348179-Amphidinium_carterae.2